MINVKDISKRKYFFYKYRRNYPNLFEKEKLKISKVLPKDSKIEHIGSTALYGLGGKGIIDILVSVKKNELKKAKNNLKTKGYKYVSAKEERERLFLSKYDKKKKKFTYHIQLTSHDSLIWKKAIAFREYLKKNKKTLKKYSEIKEKAAKFANGKGEEYRKYKDSFLKNSFKKLKIK